MSFRDKLAEVMTMIAVERVATPAWRANYHDADDKPGLYPAATEPFTIEGYQRHLIEMHDFDEGDKALEPWCGDCGEPIESPGQICAVSDRPCQGAIEDLAALHADVHDDRECYPAHEHGA